MRARYAKCLVLVGLLIGALPLAAERADGSEPPTGLRERFSYSVGARLGENLQQGDHNIDVEHLIRGLRDAFSDSVRLSEEALQSSFDAYVKFQEERRQADRVRALSEAKIEGENFLAENAQRTAVITLPSGLQYEIIRPGSGPTPSVNDRVSCHYRGALLDGTVIESTYDRGRPMTFVVANVIDGWEEALQLMSVGSKWKLYIPAELAYGENGFGTTIPPNATLLFEVELLSIHDNLSER